MDTKVPKPAPRRTRRTHELEFMAQVIKACLQPGVSVAAVALASGLNANYLRRWVKERSRARGLRSTRAVRALVGWTMSSMASRNCHSPHEHGISTAGCPLGMEARLRATPVLPLNSRRSASPWSHGATRPVAARRAPDIRAVAW